MMSRRKFKVWVNSLLDEGYDLSGYTWDELYDEYLDEALGSEFIQRGGIQGAIQRAQERAKKDGGASNRAWLGNKVKGFIDSQANFVQRGGIQGAIQRAQERAKKDGGASNRAWLGRQIGLGGSQNKPTPASTTNPPGPKPNYAAAAKAYPANTPENRTNNYYSNVAAGKYGSNKIMATNTKGEQQDVTVGKKYSGGKAGSFVYNAQGERRVVKDEFEAWVNELHEQGYDLSRYTWEGLFEYYCDEVLSEAGPTSNPFRPTNKFNPYNFDTSSSLVGNTSSSRSSGVSFPSTPSTSATTTRTSPAMSSRALAPQTKSNAPSLQSKDMSANYATWAKANPVLAAKVKPGQAGYDSIKSQLTTSSYTTPKSIIGQNKDVNTAGSQSAAAFSPSSTLNFRPSSYSSPALNSSASQTSNVSTAGSSAGRAAFGSNSTSTTSNPPTSPNMQNKRNPGGSPGGSSKPGSVYGSFDFGKSNYITEDVNYLYRSIYEGNRVDQDEDSDNDGADVMIARMIASGMSREEAIRRTRNKSYNKKGKKSDEELKEFAALLPLAARVVGPTLARAAGTRLVGAAGTRLAGAAAQKSLRSRLAELAKRKAFQMLNNKKEDEEQQQNTSSDNSSLGSSIVGGLKDIVSQMNNEEIIYYSVLDHLVENGYADSYEQAEVIFENFSEDYQYAIIEHLQSF